MGTVFGLDPSRKALIWRGIGIIAFVVHLYLFLNSTIDFQNNVRIFYLPNFSNFLFALRFITFFIVPISIWNSSKTSNRVWLPILAILVYCLLLSYLNFASILYSTWIKHVGTVRFKNNTYQITEVVKFEDPTVYYLGSCEKNGFMCEFHEVYRVSPFSEFVPEALLSNDSRYLILKINGEMVYNFDGIIETCINGDYGYCLINHLEE